MLGAKLESINKERNFKVGTKLFDWFYHCKNISAMSFTIWLPATTISSMWPKNLPVFRNDFSEQNMIYLKWNKKRNAYCSKGICRSVACSPVGVFIFYCYCK